MAELVDALVGGWRRRPVVVNGSAGVGKTRLMVEALDRVAGDATSVTHVVGSTAEAEIPFGAVAHLLPDDVAAEDQLASLRGAVRTLETAASAGADTNCVLSVDDAQWLDRGSLWRLDGSPVHHGSVSEEIRATIAALDSAVHDLIAVVALADLIGVDMLEGLFGGDVLTAAAHAAGGAMAHDLAGRYARAAVEAGAGFAARIALGEALQRRGDSAGAVVELVRAAEAATTSEERVRALALQADVLFNTQRFAEADDVMLRAESVADTAGSRHRIAVQRALFAGDAGRLAEVEQLADASAMSLPDSDEAAMWLTWVEGLVALSRGRVRRANRLFSSATDQVDHVYPDPHALGAYRSALWATLSEAAALAGRDDTAERALAAAEQAWPADMLVPFRLPARLWTAAARGDLAAARDLAVDGAGQARDIGASLLEARL